MMIMKNRYSILHFIIGANNYFCLSKKTKTVNVGQKINLIKTTKLKSNPHNLLIYNLATSIINSAIANHFSIFLVIYEKIIYNIICSI